MGVRIDIWGGNGIIEGEARAGGVSGAADNGVEGGEGGSREIVITSFGEVDGGWVDNVG